MTIDPMDTSGNENSAATDKTFPDVDGFPDGDDIDSASVSIDPLDYVPPSTTAKEVC